MLSENPILIEQPGAEVNLNYSNRSVDAFCDFFYSVVDLGLTWGASKPKKPIKMQTNSPTFSKSLLYRLSEGIGGGEALGPTAPPLNALLIVITFCDLNCHQFEIVQEEWMTPRKPRLVEADEKPANFNEVVDSYKKELQRWKESGYGSPPPPPIFVLATRRGITDTQRKVMIQMQNDASPCKLYSVRKELPYLEI